MIKITRFSYPTTLLIALNVLLLSCSSGTFTLSDSETLEFNTQEFSPFHHCVGKVDSCTDADVVGPVPEVVRVVCKEANINCRFNLHRDWQAAQTEVKTGKAQGLFIIGRPMGSDREEWLYYPSDPIVTSENGFFVKTGNPLLDKSAQEIFPSEVKNFKIGVMERNTATYESLNSFLAPVITEEILTIGKESNPPLNNESLLKLLSTGELDAVYMNREVGKSLIQALNLNGIVVYAGPRANGQQKYYIAISKLVSEKMKARFYDAYKKVHDSGTIRKIFASGGLPY